MKVAKNEQEALEIQAIFPNDPYAWIQWKGTDVCLDFYCECGEYTHYDGDFAYHLQCCKCGAVYFMNGHIEAIKLEEMPEMARVTFEDED